MQTIQKDVSIGNERVKYHIGDIIVHWTYGIGTVVAIEQKSLAGITQQYYVVEIDHLKLWVPIKEAIESSIRYPTEGAQFQALIEILQLPGGQLPDNPYKRKNELRDRMQKWTLGDLCHIIRDLTDRAHHFALNQDDMAVLSRAQGYLLDEWVLSLTAERSNALRELEGLLRGDLLEITDQSAKFPSQLTSPAG